MLEAEPAVLVQPVARAGGPVVAGELAAGRLADPLVQVWRINAGRVKLYLLDTDLEENAPWDRELSARLDPTAASMQTLFQEVKSHPKRVIFAEGEEAGIEPYPRAHPAGHWVSDEPAGMRQGELRGEEGRSVFFVGGAPQQPAAGETEEIVGGQPVGR